MLKIIQQFLIIYIIVFAIQMIYFYFRNKSKKYGTLPTTAMIYLIKAYKIDILRIGISYVEKQISLVNSFIVTVDLLIYFNFESIFLKVIIMFVTTFVLIFICYTMLAKHYKKLLGR